MLDPEKTIQSQYAASPTINAVIQKVNDRIDPRKDIKAFYDKIFNLETAEGIGLDYWGRIVALTRKVTVVNFEDNFGFDGSEDEPFDEGVFYQDYATSSGVYDFGDKAFRQLIRWKAAANIGSVSLGDITNSLRNLFKNSLAVIKEDGVMQVRIIFLFKPSIAQLSLLETYRSYFIGAGVKVTTQSMPLNYLGFTEGDGLQPWGQSPFYNDDVIEY